MESKNSPDATPRIGSDFQRFQWSHHTLLSSYSSHDLAWNDQSTSATDLEHASSFPWTSGVLESHWLYHSHSQCLPSRTTPIVFDHVWSILSLSNLLDSGLLLSISIRWISRQSLLEIAEVSPPICSADSGRRGIDQSSVLFLHDGSSVDLDLFRIYSRCHSFLCSSS